MKIYAISGLGADKRVFDYLKLEVELIYIDWIDPKGQESLSDYAKRLSAQIDTREDFIILGVSFGGMIATEISHQLNPKLSILISSAETRLELRPIIRFFDKVGFLRILPTKLFTPPKRIVKYLFGTSKIELLYQILDDTDLSFAKWAVIQMTKWKRTNKLKKNLLKISGSKDKLIPPKDITNSIVIENGEHFMIVDKADEISEIINNRISKIFNSK